MGVGTFYLHFHDKDDLLAVLIREGFDRVRAQVLAAVVPSPPDHRLPALLRAVFQVAYVERDLFAIALTSGRARPGLPDRAALTTALAQVLFDAREHGALADRDPELLAALLSGLVNQGVLWWLDHDQPSPDPMGEGVLWLLRGGLATSLIPDDR